MNKSKIILFTGLPGTGKTTISRQVAGALNMPLLAKDAIKEIMFDNLGWSDKAWSAKLAHATFDIMDYMTEQQLKAGHSLILESNYLPKLSSEKFQRWQEAYSCTIIQIVCRTELEVLANRFMKRTLADRHPGHLDQGTIASYQEEFSRRIENGEDQPLDVKGNVLVVDTTNFDRIDMEGIVTWLKQEVHKFSISPALHL